MRMAHAKPRDLGKVRTCSASNVLMSTVVADVFGTRWRIRDAF